MNLTDNFTINLRRDGNPCQYGSERREYWKLLRDGMSVGEFLTAFLAQNPGREKGHGRRFLQVMISVGWIDIPGYRLEVRGPRAAAISSTALTTLSTDLSSWTFGPEFEVLLPRVGYGSEPRRAAVEALTAAGVEARQEGYVRTSSSGRESARGYWAATTDGSLGDYNRGTEFKAPILKGNEGLAEIRKFCAALRNYRATGYDGREGRVTAPKSCGFHVHVGCANEDANFFRNLLRLYGRNEDHIDSALPAVRRTNGSSARWARPIRYNAIRDTMTKDEVINAVAPRSAGSYSSYKYHKINLMRYWDIGTVEFRQAAGTVEADKAEYWIVFCLRMCNAAKAGRQERVASFDELLEVIGASDEEKAFWNRRRADIARHDGR